MRRISITPGTSVERTHSLLLQLLLPRIDLVWVHVIPLRQVCLGRLFARRFQANLRLRVRVDLASLLRHHRLRLPRRNPTRSNCATGPKLGNQFKTFCSATITTRLWCRDTGDDHRPWFLSQVDCRVASINFGITGSGVVGFVAVGVGVDLGGVRFRKRRSGCTLTPFAEPNDGLTLIVVDLSF